MDRERSYRHRESSVSSPPILGLEPMATLALRLCGDVVLTSDNAAVDPPLGSKTLALLAFLALESGRHTRHEVTALLWGEYPEEKAKASLRQALTHLELRGLERADGFPPEHRRLERRVTSG